MNEQEILDYIFGKNKKQVDLLKTFTNQSQGLAQQVSPLFESLNAYNKDNLMKGLLKWVKVFYEKERDFCVKSGLSRPLLDFFTAKKGAANKSEVINFCTPVFETKEIFEKFRASLPSNLQTVLYELIFSDSLNEFEIEKITGYKPYTEEKERWGTGVKREIETDYYLFMINAGDSYGLTSHRTKYALSLPHYLRKLLKSYYPVPEDSVIKAVSEEVVKAQSKTFLGEAHLIQDLMKVIAYQLQDNLKFSQRGKPNASSVNKMRKTIKLAEFYEEDEDLGNIRSYILATLMADFTKNDMKEDIASQVKVLYKGIESDYQLPELLLPHFKGFHQLWESQMTVVTPKIAEMLLQMPANQWVAMSNLEMYCKYNQINLCPVDYDYGLNNYIYYETKTPTSYGGSYTEKNYVKVSRAHTFISYPFLRGTLFTMATLGMLDIAYTKPNVSDFGKTYYSNYDGLAYFRLTSLGEFVLGRTKDYESNVSTAGGKLVFSEDSLILLAEGDVSLYEVLLRNYAERVTDTRFRVTYQTFLKDTKTKKELKQKIDIFRQTVSRVLPANWEAFLAEMTEKSKAFSPKENITIFQLPAKDRELQRLIAQDKILKELVIKAESFHVLIVKDNLAKFKNRLKEFGYIVD